MTTIQPIVQQAQERSSLQNQTSQQISKFIAQQQTLQELMKGDLKIFTMVHIKDKLCITVLPVILIISSLFLSLFMSYSLSIFLFLSFSFFSLSLYLSLSLSVYLSLSFSLSVSFYLSEKTCGSKFCDKMLAAAAPSSATTHSF